MLPLHPFFVNFAIRLMLECDMWDFASSLYFLRGTPTCAFSLIGFVHEEKICANIKSDWTKSIECLIWLSSVEYGYIPLDIAITSTCMRNTCEV